MRRWLIFGALFLATLTYGARLLALSGADAAPPVLQRFLASAEAPVTEYRALRHLEARNDKLNAGAWMDVWTDATMSGFQYQIVAEGGSGYIRSHVFLPALETEREMRAAGAAGRGAITPDNYLFVDRGAEANGLAWVGLTPRRKDVLLVDGSIFLKPEDGDLVRIQGSLSKTPSFWTRRVDIVRRYSRVGGVRLVVALESVASVRIAGTSTFTMTYDYESVNGQHVGSPVATTLDSRVATR